MRKMLAVGAALALASSLAGAQGMGMTGGGMSHGPQGAMMGGGMGPHAGMMMGGGAGMMGAGGPLAALNLSDEQRDKVLAIQEEHRKKNWAAMGEVRSEQFKLRGMYGADKLDADKIAEQQKRVDELRRQMLKSRVETHNKVAAVLTPEQRKQLRSHAPWWMGEQE
jgi:Spy/CpxP family protein refolding chaperone